MAKFYNPNGNAEIWETKPNGYFTEEEWESTHNNTDVGVQIIIDDTPSLEQRINDIELALMELAEVM